MRSLLAFAFWGVSAVALSGQEIELVDGQVLFTYRMEDQRVRTSDVEIVLSFEGDDVQPRIRIELSDLQRGIRGGGSFEQSPGEPKMIALNTAYRCNERIIFLTLRYPPPRHADIRSYFFETYAFHSDTLDYLAMAPVAYEDIGLQEFGTNLGWRYSSPQPYQIVCGTGSKGFALDMVPKSETR